MLRELYCNTPKLAGHHGTDLQDQRSGRLRQEDAKFKFKPSLGDYLSMNVLCSIPSKKRGLFLIQRRRIPIMKESINYLTQ